MQIGKGKELQDPIWHSGTCKSFLIHVGSAQEAIKKKGFFKAYNKASKAHLEHCGAIKQAKAKPAKIGGSTGEEAGTSKKSKKAKELAKGGQADPALCAVLLAKIKQAQSNVDKAKAKGEQAAMDMFQLYANTRGTRLSKSRPKVTPIQISKAVPKKYPGDFHASCLIIV